MEAFTIIVAGAQQLGACFSTALDAGRGELLNSMRLTFELYNQKNED